MTAEVWDHMGQGAWLAIALFVIWVGLSVYWDRPK